MLPAGSTVPSVTNATLAVPSFRKLRPVGMASTRVTFGVIPSGMTTDTRRRAISPIATLLPEIPGSEVETRVLTGAGCGTFTVTPFCAM